MGPVMRKGPELFTLVAFSDGIIPGEKPKVVLLHATVC